MTADSETSAARRPRLPELRQLSLLSSRELLRNVKTLVSLLFMFFFFLILIFGIDYVVNGARHAPVVTVAAGSSTSEIIAALEQRGIEVREAESDDATARIAVNAGSARIVLSEPHPPAWKGLVAAVHSTGIPTSRIAVVDASGAVEVDVLRVNLATVLVTGFLAIAFMGTSVPLVALRQRGTLRLLGTTPARRSSFILAQSPVRFALGLGEAVIVVLVAWWQGYVESFDALRLFVTLVLGLAMLFAFAYLLASRAVNAELITQLSGFLPVIVILTAGTVFPMDVFPDAVRYATYVFPSTWFMQAASADLAGTVPFLPVPWLWVMMTATAAVVGALAARLFTWDQGEL